MAGAEALTGPRAGAWRPRWRGLPTWVYALPPVAGLGLVFLYPLALVGRQSVSPDSGGHSTAAYREIFTEESFRKALWNTVWIAVGSV